MQQLTAPRKGKCPLFCTILLWKFHCTVTPDSQSTVLSQFSWIPVTGPLGCFMERDPPSRRDVWVSDPSCSDNRIYQRQVSFLHSQTLQLSQFFSWDVVSHTQSRHRSPVVLFSHSGRQITWTSFCLIGSGRNALNPWSAIGLFSPKSPRIVDVMLTFLDIAAMT